jgi:hypothetical protein
LVWLAGIFGVAFTQTSTTKQVSQPFSIVISTETPIIKAGSALSIKIRLTNISSHDVKASSAYFDGTDASYSQEVRYSNGDLAKTVHPNAETRASGHWILHMLRPGESADSTTGISPEYDVSRPGQYVIQVSRLISDDQSGTTVKSNMITVTVTP